MRGIVNIRHPSFDVFKVLIPLIVPLFVPLRGDDMALTALEVKKLTCPEGKKQVKKSDGNGLNLLIKNNG